MKKVFFVLISSLLLLVGTSSYATAQVSASVSLEPKNPTPKSSVSLTLQSYSFNVTTATIVWKVGGKIVLEGQGADTLVLQTGEVGESDVVNVRAETADGISFEQSVTVTPSSVALIYEAPNSYVPLLYPGRSLPSTGGLMRVTALPSMSDGGRLVRPSTLSYSWYVNNTILKQESGLGKQSASIALDYLTNKTEIKVIVRSPLGNVAEKKLAVYPHAILPLLYTYDSILGPNFNALVGKRFEAREDFTFSLEPFYVSEEQNAPSTAMWYLNGIPSTPLGGRILSLHPKEDSYGTKMLSISVFGQDKRLQKAETKTELIFDTRK